MFPKRMNSILLCSLVFMLYMNRVNSAETSQSAGNFKDECDKELTNENISTVKNLAFQYLNEEKWADAIRCFTKLIDGCYLRSACLNARAKCYQKLGETDKANEDLAFIERLDKEASRRGY